MCNSIFSVAAVENLILAGNATCIKPADCSIIIGRGREKIDTLCLTVYVCMHCMKSRVTCVFGKSAHIAYLMLFAKIPPKNYTCEIIFSNKYTYHALVFQYQPNVFNRKFDEICCDSLSFFIVDSMQSTNICTYHETVIKKIPNALNRIGNPLTYIFFFLFLLSFLQLWPSWC